MIGKVRSFLEMAYGEGALTAVLAAGASVLPPPYEQRLSFTRSFLEQRSEAPPSRKSQLRMWRQGFVPKSHSLYDFDTYGTDAYLSDLAEEFGWGINEPSQKYLNDKRKFHELLEDRGFGDYLPTIHGTLSDGVLVGSGTDFVSFLDEEGTLVVKDRTGAAGNRVHICESGENRYFVDGEKHSESSLRERISDFEEYIVTEYCRQTTYAASIYPDTPNTIRIVTMNPTDRDPFIASAVHRIGTDASGAVDNFSQGGLSAEVTDTGELGPAVRYIDGTVSWHDRHPDTGSRIAGTVVPGWQPIRGTVLSAATAVPELTYIGWDVLVTGDEDFKIIEGNSNTDTDLLQAHDPLLRDERVRRFYREHGVL